MSSARPLPGPTAVEVLVVDDHRIFAEVLAAHLRHHDEVAQVEVALSLDEARVALRSFHPQVVLLDHDVGGENGTDLIPELARLEQPPHVVMVSASSDSATIISALEAGAEAWVGKDARVEVLLLATSEVLQDHLYLYPPTMKPVIHRLLVERGGPRERTFVDQLSNRELEVLRCLVAGLTRTEVAKRLYISPNTVRTHVQRLLRRASVHSTVALVAAARNAGVTPVNDSEAAARPPRQRAWSE